MVQLGFHGPDIYDILLFEYFLKSFEEIRVSLQSDKKNGYFT